MNLKCIVFILKNTHINLYAYQDIKHFHYIRKILSLTSESSSLPPFTQRQEDFFCHILVLLVLKLIEMESEHIHTLLYMTFYTLNFEVGGCCSLLTCISISFLFINRIPFCSMNIPQFVHLFSYLWVFVTFKFLVIVKKAYINILL